jgi:hypothetical protein
MRKEDRHEGLMELEEAVLVDRVVVVGLLNEDVWGEIRTGEVVLGKVAVLVAEGMDRMALLEIRVNVRHREDLVATVTVTVTVTVIAIAIAIENGIKVDGGNVNLII